MNIKVDPKHKEIVISRNWFHRLFGGKRIRFSSGHWTQSPIADLIDEFNKSTR